MDSSISVPIHELDMLSSTVMSQSFGCQKRKLKPECTTHSKAFVDETPSPNEIIPQSEVFEDNAVCLKFAQMPKLSPRTKYLAVPLHWWRSKVINLEIGIRYIPSASQLGDQFTKGLEKEPFERSIMSLMGW
jgi:hypothetical protein